MKVLTDSTAATISNEQIEIPCSHLLLVLTHGSANVALLEAAKIGVKITDNNGNRRDIYPNNMTILDAAEMGSVRDGLNILADEENEKSYIMIPLTKDRKCLPIKTGETIQLDIKGLIGAATSYTMNLYAVEGAEMSNKPIFMQFETQLNKTKAYKITDTDVFAIQKSDTITEVLISFKNGRSASYSYDEMKQIDIMNNEIVALKGGETDGIIQFGTDRLFILDTHDISEIKVSNDGSALNVYRY